MTAWPKTEVELAEPVVAWLEAMDWDVFQEVENGGARADIVARRGSVVWAIEVKRSLGLALLAQAHHWLGRAHMVSVAYPHGRRQGSRELAKRYAQLDGVGLIEVSKTWRGVDQVRVVERGRPALTRRIRGGFQLLDAHKTFAKAGNADGRFWSPFKETCERVRAVVEAQPGLTVTEVVARVDHHYASKQSARGSLLSWAKAGKLDGVMVRGGSKDAGAFRFYPTGWHGPIRDRRMLAARRAGSVGASAR